MSLPARQMGRTNSSGGPDRSPPDFVFGGMYAGYRTATVPARGAPCTSTSTATSYGFPVRRKLFFTASEPTRPSNATSFAPRDTIRIGARAAGSPARSWAPPSSGEATSASG